MSRATLAGDAGYYAFLLEALDRFGGEGTHLKRPFDPFRRGLKPSLRSAVARQMRRQGLATGTILEFGVYKGASIRELARLFPGSRIVGFDTFSGFPEDGRTDWRASDFATAIPAVPAGVELVVGAFRDTLPGFAARADVEAPAGLIHVDCDLYSSTACAFEMLGSRFLRPGTVILFDELLNYDRMADNEFLAFFEMLDRLDLDFEWFVTVGSLFPILPLMRGETPGGWKRMRAAGYFQSAAVRLTAGPFFRRGRARFEEEAQRLAEERRNLPG